MRSTWLAAVVLVASCSQPLDDKRLYAAVRDLRAVAAEARLLVVQTSRGDSPAAYFDEQRAFLTERGRKVQDQLARGVEDPALQAPLREAVGAGARLMPRVQSERDPHAFDDLIVELSRLETQVAP
jgi:hypothetical protein